MNTYVIDTSVAVAWYLDESFSAAAQAWQEGVLIYWQSLNLELRKTGKCTKPAHFLIP